ncbi:hypothetical protein JTB14_003159 [Gonioctena quinquepunctata]|nr:hypothetical protein JTB14_003159 [Gonioctena quinquepunctata]
MLSMKLERQRGGQDGSTYMVGDAVFPKADQHRYAKCVKVSEVKMNIMWHLTRGILGNMEYTGEHKKDDKKLMGNIVLNMMSEDKKRENYFFVGRSESKNAILVDDLVLKKMEKFGNIFLSRREKMFRNLMATNDMKFNEVKRDLSDASNLLAKVDITFSE